MSQNCGEAHDTDYGDFGTASRWRSLFICSAHLMGANCNWFVCCCWAT